ncbi:MAG: hypothetical protein HQK72_04400 [Desulfamplus sp.]|nr:hypothetical protein [Desulfamplus sp.]
MINIEENSNIYEKKTAIGYSTIAKHGTIKIVSIMNFLQDAASEHAHLMGISGFDLAKENLGWVIFRYHIEIKNHPDWQEKIRVQTYRFPCKNLYEIRVLTITKDVQKNIKNEQENFTSPEIKIKERDNEFVNAKGCWIMINKKNGRPVRLSRFTDKELGFVDTNKQSVIADVIIDKDSAQEPLSSKNIEVSEKNEGLESHFAEVIKPETIHYQLPFKVRMHDLDLNGHVNNAIFVEWGVETVPENILSKFFPATIDVVFNKESLYGDVIISHTEIRQESGNPFTLHSIIRQQDQAELARLNICWQVLPEKRLPFSIITKEYSTSSSSE